MFQQFTEQLKYLVFIQIGIILCIDMLIQTDTHQGEGRCSRHSCVGSSTQR